MTTKMLAKNKSLIKKDGEPKPKKKGNNQYGLYSGIITDGKQKDNPTEKESIVNMVNYMKNNNPPESTNPSNVYRPQFSHISMAYNRKKKQNTA
jgi:hypothetical protein